MRSSRRRSASRSLEAPGFRRYRPYTRDPRADVWAASDFGVPALVPRHVTRVLRSLGYREHLHLVPSADITPTMRRNFQLSVDGNWAPDYPSPSAYLPQFFGCRGGNSNGYFCDPALDRRMAQASAVQLRDPARAASLWAAIDRRLVDQAAWLPTVNVRAVEFVSERVRDYEYSR